MDDDPLHLVRNEPDRLRRGLLLVALLGEAIQEDPIVVGGFAVEAWTDGGYTTADIDLICRRRDAALAWLESVGFERRNRHMVHGSLGLAVEIPGTVLDEGRGAYDRLVQWEIDGRRATLLSVEDTIVDRLAAMVHGHADGEWENALRLLAAWAGRLDESVLEARAQAEHVSEALARARRWLQVHLGDE